MYASVVAGGGAPPLPRDDRTGDAASRRRAAFHRAGELRPWLHTQLLQDRRVVVERMARQEEADRIVFALEPVGRQPGLGLRQQDRLPLAPAAEEFTLPDRCRLMRALGAGEHDVDPGED